VKKLAEKILTRVTTEEEDQVSRFILGYLNRFPDKPVDLIGFEYLKDDEPSMAISLIQGTDKTRSYITGGYEAQSQFKVIYRLQATNNNARLGADELLNSLADWAVTNTSLIELGGNRAFRSLESNTRSALFGRYENGDEDHQILMTLTYEVI
jgi:hypothetical protein